MRTPFIIAAFLVVGNAFAQVNSAESAATAALNRHPLTAAARKEIEAAKAGKNSLGALRNPDIELIPALTEFGSDTELLIRQPLELNGQRSARRQVGSIQAEAARLQAIDTLRSLVRNAKVAWYDYVRASARLAAALEFERLSKAQLDALARQVEEGARPGIEKMQLELELAGIQREALKAESQRSQALSRLISATGESDVNDANLPPVKAQQFVLEDLVVNALSFRGDMRLAMLDINLPNAEAGLVRAEGMPDFALQYRQESFTREPRVGGFGLAVTIPILDYGSRRGRITQLNALADAARRRFESVQLGAVERVSNAFLEYESANRIAVQFEGLIAKADELMRISATGFQGGQITISQYLDAQRTRQQTQLDFIDAQVDALNAQAELEFEAALVPDALLMQVLEGRQ